jgi:TonB family protein
VEGARPDGTPRASRGNTPDPARNGNQSQQAQQAQQAQEALDEQKARQAQTRGQSGNDRIIPNNTNPNALQIPRPITSSDIGRLVDDQLGTARRNAQGGRTGISRSDNNGTFSTDSSVQVLSPNPKGIDFGPYLNLLLSRLRDKWYSVMPEMARLGQQGRVDIVFAVTKSGLVKDVKVVLNSNYEALDQGAISAIKLSNPFQPLPAEYETDLRLRIGFLYNMSQ